MHPGFGYVKHLGWVIPSIITGLMGQRHRYPGRGRCHECSKSMPRVYIRGDGTPYCSDCIESDLAAASPSDKVKRQQKHPAPAAGQRYEIRYDLIEGAVFDGADLRVYEQAFT